MNSRSDEDLAGLAGWMDDLRVDRTGIQAAFDEVFDQAIVNGYVWGVCWQTLYPGMRLPEESAEARRWSRDIGMSFYEAAIETNGHNVSLVFADLSVDVIGSGHAPFVVPADGPDFKIYPS